MLDPRQPVTLSELARAVGRSWRVLAAGTFVGLLVGAGIQVALPQTYSATATVRVDATGVDPLAEPQTHPVDMATEEQLAGSRSVAGARQVEVHALKDSSVLRIRHTGRTAGDAAAGANVIARAYLSHRSTQATADLARVRAVLDRELESLPDAKGPQAQQLMSDLARSRRLATSGGAIIEAARPPDRGDLPGLSLSCLAGAILGMVGAVPVAALHTRPPAELFVLDVDRTAAPALRQGVAALADHVLVVQDGERDPHDAQLWCDRLRAVGISATVVEAELSQAPEAPAS